MEGQERYVVISRGVIEEGAERHGGLAVGQRV